MTNDNYPVQIESIGNTSDRVVDICASFIMTQWGFAIPSRSTESYTDLFNEYAKSGGIPHINVAFFNDQPVGMACIRYEESYLPTVTDTTIPTLTMVFTHPNFRGNGVGTKLVTSIETHAKDLDIPEIYLNTPDKEPFYLHLGWKTIGQMPNPINDNTNRTSVIMQKNLG